MPHDFVRVTGPICPHNDWRLGVRVFEGGRSRPTVTVWCEDSDGELVAEPILLDNFGSVTLFFDRVCSLLEGSDASGLPDYKLAEFLDLFQPVSDLADHG